MRSEEVNKACTFPGCRSKISPGDVIAKINNAYCCVECLSFSLLAQIHNNEDKPINITKITKLEYTDGRPFVYPKGVEHYIRKTTTFNILSAIYEETADKVNLGSFMSYVTRMHDAAHAYLKKYNYPLKPPFDCYVDQAFLRCFMEQHNSGTIHEFLSFETSNFRTNFLHTALRLGENDFPVVKLSSALTAALLATDAGTLLGEYVKQPFSAFVIELEQGITYLGKNLIRIIFTSYNIPATGPVLSMKTTGEKLSVEDFYKTHVALRTQTGIKKVWQLTFISDDDKILRYLVKPPADDMSIGNWLVGLKAEDEKIKENSIISEAKASRKFFSFIVNLFVWMSESKEFKTRTGRAASTKKGEKPRRHREWQLGREIKLPGNMIKTIFQQKSEEPLWKIQSRFVVRGHWREQACGEKRLDRKRIWIQPHWKGPEDGNRMSKIYVT